MYVHFFVASLIIEEVLVSCKYLLPEQRTEIEKTLKDNKAHSTLIDKVKLSLDMITDLGISVDTFTHSPKSQRKHRKNKKKQKNKHVEENYIEKKSPLKTCMDVVHRLYWDDQLNVEDFTLGYLDCFMGLVERPVTAFSWEDISTVDYYTNAIPKHHILFFKYKRSVIVWEKAKRFDHVFGSDGSKITIYDVIADFEKVC